MTQQYLLGVVLATTFVLVVGVATFCQ